MNTYKCQDCGGLQYSSNTNKAGESCIYCGKTNVQLEPAKEQKDRKDPS